MPGESLPNGMDPYQLFVHQHKNQLESGGVPPQVWKTLYQKLTNGVFDAGIAFTLLSVQYEEGEWEPGAPRWQVQAQVDMKPEDNEHIYLIDHAWTYQTEKARSMLNNVPGLADRMGCLMDIDDYDTMTVEEKTNVIMYTKWMYSLTYSVASADQTEQRQPVWYVMDEFGSRIQHSDEPNFRVVPFIYMGDGLGYSLMFPVQEVFEGEEVTRDYVESPEATDPVIRKCLLAAWKPYDVAIQDFGQKEPSTEFFLSGRLEESLPDPGAKIEPLPTERKIKVYAEYEFIRKNLSDSRFELTDSLADADILWLATHFKDFENFSKECPEKRINQFPFENVITIKDLLCVVSRRAAGKSITNGPKWLPITFNLKTELREFLSCYQQREDNGEDNHWIIKPWNLARALDTQVSNNISHILRLPFSGPKIVQKYLHDPVLFDRPEIGKVKFDIRYIILLQSVKPLKVYAYNRFWLRFANISFDLTDLDIYEKHFTVMNYIPTNLKQMYCNEFIQLFEQQNPGFNWKEVESSIFQMIKGVFEGATSLPPPAGIGNCPQAGAMYATDLMLAWDRNESGAKIGMTPQLLEFNWSPDCERACNYYPEFFNNVFNTLFLNNTEGQNVTLL